MTLHHSDAEEGEGRKGGREGGEQRERAREREQERERERERERESQRNKGVDVLFGVCQLMGSLGVLPRRALPQKQTQGTIYKTVSVLA